MTWTTATPESKFFSLLFFFVFINLTLLPTLDYFPQTTTPHGDIYNYIVFPSLPNHQVKYAEAHTCPSRRPTPHPLGASENPRIFRTSAIKQTGRTVAAIRRSGEHQPSTLQSHLIAVAAVLRAQVERRHRRRTGPVHACETKTSGG